MDEPQQCQSESTVVLLELAGVELWAQFDLLWAVGEYEQVERGAF